MRSIKNGRHWDLGAATIEMCPLTRSQETFSLSRGQSRCVEGHGDLWLERLASLALRVVQPMHSPLTRAHPSPPSVPAHVPPPLCAGCRHCVGYHTRRRSPPAGPSTDRGRGSNPRGGTTAWSHPRRREVPHGADGGRSTTSSAGRRYSHPPAPLAPCISHPQPTERMPSPGMFAPSRHALTFCPSCSLAGPSPISRPVSSIPRCRWQRC